MKLLIALLPVVFMIHDFEEIINVQAVAHEKQRGTKAPFSYGRAFFDPKPFFRPFHIGFCRGDYAPVSIDFGRNVHFATFRHLRIVVRRFCSLFPTSLYAYRTMDCISEIRPRYHYFAPHSSLLRIYLLPVYPVHGNDRRTIAPVGFCRHCCGCLELLSGILPRKKISLLGNK